MWQPMGDHYWVRFFASILIKVSFQKGVGVRIQVETRHGRKMDSFRSIQPETSWALDKGFNLSARDLIWLSSLAVKCSSVSRHPTLLPRLQSLVPSSAGRFDGLSIFNHKSNLSHNRSFYFIGSHSLDLEESKDQIDWDSYR